MATKKKVTKKVSNPPLKILISLDTPSLPTEENAESLLGEVCNGNYYYADTTSELVSIVDEGDEESAQDVYEVSFKKIGTITMKSRVFNEYV